MMKLHTGGAQWAACLISHSRTMGKGRGNFQNQKMQFFEWFLEPFWDKKRGFCRVFGAISEAKMRLCAVFGAHSEAEW